MLSLTPSPYGAAVLSLPWLPDLLDHALGLDTLRLEILSVNPLGDKAGSEWIRI